MKHESLIVMWDMPQNINASTFYRRLHELLEEHGGMSQCRATKSAYIVSGPDARILAYAIGALASAFGAGKVGEQDGVVVLPLGELSPADHFAALKQASSIVDKLTVDRRKRDNKRAPRSIAVLATQTRSKKNEDPLLVDLTEILARASASKEA